MIATTIEQSKRLLEAGIDPQTADMFYKNIFPWKNIEPKYSACLECGNPIEAHEWYNAGYTLSGKPAVDLLRYCMPAWSLSALVLLLPEHVFYRLARACGKNVEGLFEDCVKYLCMKSDDQKRHMMATL